MYLPEKSVNRHGTDLHTARTYKRRGNDDTRTEIFRDKEGPLRNTHTSIFRGINGKSGSYEIGREN